MTDKEIVQIIGKYELRIVEGRLCAYNLGRDKKAACAVIEPHAQEIVSYLKAQAAAEAQAEAERQAKIDAIEGLKYFESLLIEWEAYNCSDYQYIENDLIGVAPVAPTETMAQAAARFPRAAAYCNASEWARASNLDKYRAGKRAVERIIAGDDHEQVMADMEQEWTDAAHAHMWD